MSPYIQIVIEHVARSPRNLEFRQVLVTIGRGWTNDIVLDEPGISKTHARLHFDGTELLVEDLSQSGTFVVEGEQSTRVLGRRALDRRTTLLVSGFTLAVSVMGVEASLQLDQLRLEAEAMVSAPLRCPSVNGLLELLEVRQAIHAWRITNSDPPDWRRIATIMRTLLGRGEADLEVASYATHSLFRTQGLRGFLLGLLATTRILVLGEKQMPGKLQRNDLYVLSSLYDLAEAAALRASQLNGELSVLTVVCRDFDQQVTRAFGPPAPKRASTPDSHVSVTPRERVNIRYGMSNLLDKFLREKGAESTHEDRVMEVALSRELTIGATYPLFVLIRLVTTDTLLHRLARKARNPGDSAAADASEMHIDFPRSSRGESLPVRCIVSVRSDDVICEPPSVQVRIYFNRDAPLSVLNITPRHLGPTRLVVEARVEDDLIGSEHVWRQCIERSAGDALVQCQHKAVTLTSMSRERRLVECLSQLFSAASLRRWIYLFASDWASELPADSVSDNEMAFAVVETGLRSSRLHEDFFTSLARDFPRRAEALADLGAFFTEDEPG